MGLQTWVISPLDIYFYAIRLIVDTFRSDDKTFLALLYLFLMTSEVFRKTSVIS